MILLLVIKGRVDNRKLMKMLLVRVSRGTKMTIMLFRRVSLTEEKLN